MRYKSCLMLLVLTLGCSTRYLAESQSRHSLNISNVHLTMYADQGSISLDGIGRRGIRVEEVGHGYLGLLPGDVIMTAAGMVTADPQHFVAILKSRNPAPVHLQVYRANKMIELQVQAADYRKLIPPDPPAPPAPPTPPAPPPPIG